MKKSEFDIHVKEAMHLSSGISESFRPFAFQAALSLLLQTKLPQTIQHVVHKKKQSNYLEDILESDFDWSATNIPNLKSTLQNLSVLKLVQENFEFSKLTAHDIQIILSQKFRISKTPNAISMSLMQEVGKHVNRTNEQKKFYYEITANGIAYLNSQISEVK